MTGGVQGPTCGLSQQAAEAGGSLTSETREGREQPRQRRDERSTARSLGLGKRDVEVYECRNRWWNPLKKLAGSNLVDQGRDGSAPNLLTTGRKGPDGQVGVGGHEEGLRRSRGQACRGKAGHHPVQRSRGERGNRG